MKKGIVLLGLFVFLSVSFTASFVLYSGDMNPQDQKKVLQQKKVLLVPKPTVTSVTPQKVKLAQGGDAVVVEVKGTNLTMIDSVQVTRDGTEAAGIEEVLDRSQLPTVLKISLTATQKAAVATDYRLTVFDAGNNKLMEVPGNLIAIDTVPLPERPLKQQVAIDRKVSQATTQIEQKKLPQPRPIDTTVEGFLQSVLAARSLAEIKAAYDKANLSQSEQDELRRKIEASPELQKNLNRHLAEQKASAKALIDQRNREFAAKIEAAKLEQRNLQLEALDQPPGVLLTRCPPADQPTIDIVKGAPLIPGKEFRILGKGFGEPRPGSIDLMIPGPIPAQRAIIISWKACEVHARFSGEISGMRASNEASLVLKTSDGKEATKVTSFQPLWDYFYIDHSGGCPDDLGSAIFGCSEDRTMNNFILKNDYIIYKIEFSSQGDGGHAEITVRPLTDTPNVSARTVIHTGAKAFGFGYWDLHVSFRGPKGLPFR